MGDWYELPDGGWRYEPSAPDPDQSVTSMVPIVKPTPYPRGPVDEVEPADPEDFPAFDTIDSRLIRSLGAPD